jgi:hypothetical protein
VRASVERFDRQVRLAEIGAAGQARISGALISVGLDDLATDIAVRYLAGAGVRGVRVRDVALAEGARAIAPGIRVEVDPALPVDAEALAFDIRDPTCRDICRGAHAALRALRAALEEG